VLCDAEYGDKENTDLADRFNIKKDDWPEYRLFLQGKSEPVIYTGDEARADDIQKFIVQESGKSKVIAVFNCYNEYDVFLECDLKVSR